MFTAFSGSASSSSSSSMGNTKNGVHLERSILTEFACIVNNECLSWDLIGKLNEHFQSDLYLFNQCIGTLGQGFKETILSRGLNSIQSNEWRL